MRYMLPVSRLVNKLLEAEVAEKRDGELTFTSSFGGYLLCSMVYYCNTANVGTHQGWREILADFEPSLADLSPEEIEAMVILMDYYLNHAEHGTADLR
ncbi:MAG TPA: hypothetical protein VHA09_01540 [Nitrososphaera sp.]|nr:hypothetical protein [Nitrososphaera sp.]